MAFWKIFPILLVAATLIDASRLHHKREISNICSPIVNNTNKVQCFCVKNKKDPTLIANADCYLTNQNVAIDDNAWTNFKTLGHVPKITLSNTRGIALTYIPTEALKETTALKKLDVKYGMINTIGSFAFANLSLLQEISLRDNQIVLLDPYAFVHHKDLKSINLDTNSIREINRHVFVDIPSLEKLYLTNNQISTIHDKAFIHLINLKELEIDRNKIFSLNYAVFEGLKNLEKLDLSSNSLEVIGDNTFQALENLKMLNLEGNSIQMLDEKAFYGLGKLRTLSLAHNKLTVIDSDKVFEGLESLIQLNLKGNQLKELKSTVMAPILTNFYGNNSNLDVEDNNFPCACHLDWFIALKNRTSNKYLEITIENLKCIPDAQLREAWAKTDKNAPQAFEEEDGQGQVTNEYEYYDDTQLDGKLFYVDVRDLLKCNEGGPTKTPTSTTTEGTKDKTSPVTSTTVTTTSTTTAYEISEQPPTETTAEISSTSQVVSTTQNNLTPFEDMGRRNHFDVQSEETFTTTRLATVSAKPVETKIMYENMASDEAVPDRIKAHRSVEEENKNTRRAVENYQANNANNILGSVLLLFLTVLIYSRSHV